MAQFTAGMADDKKCPGLKGGAVEGSAQFLVTKSDYGYSLLLPPGLLKKLPYKDEYNVSLTTTNGESATISGVGAKDGDNFLNITTSQAFKIPSIDRNKLKSLDIWIRDRSPEGSESKDKSKVDEPCPSGCPRVAFLYCWDRECTICLCEHDPTKKKE